jgi:hypothetical protein
VTGEISKSRRRKDALLQALKNPGKVAGPEGGQGRRSAATKTNASYPKRKTPREIVSAFAAKARTAARMGPMRGFHPKAHAKPSRQPLVMPESVRADLEFSLVCVPKLWKRTSRLSQRKPREKTARPKAILPSQISSGTHRFSSRAAPQNRGVKRQHAVNNESRIYNPFSGQSLRNSNVHFGVIMREYVVAANGQHPHVTPQKDDLLLATPRQL